MLVALKPPAVRKLTIQQVIERLRERLGKVEGVRTLFTPVQDLALGVQSSASRYQYTLTASDPTTLSQWSDQMRRAMADLKTDVDRRDRKQRDRRAAGRSGDRPGACRGNGRHAAGGGQHALRCVRPTADPHDLSAAQLFARRAGGGAGMPG